MNNGIDCGEILYTSVHISIVYRLCGGVGLHACVFVCDVYMQSKPLFEFVTGVCVCTRKCVMVCVCPPVCVCFVCCIVWYGWR